MQQVQPNFARYFNVNTFETWVQGVHPSWAACIAETEHPLRQAAQQCGPEYEPEPTSVLAALRTPLHEVRVILLGQDPYPTPGVATGLAFAVNPTRGQVPGSLRNIVKEWSSDLGGTWPTKTVPDIRTWAREGVLMLNTALTVEPHRAGSHTLGPWKQFTTSVLEYVCAKQRVVVLAWGVHAQKVASNLDAVTVASAHPSPLSAHRGFLGSRPFSRCNQELLRLRLNPVRWDVQFY